MNTLNNSDEVAIDVGRVALEASEGVSHGSDPEDFFLAAGNAVLFWLPLNGYPILTAEQMVPTEESTKAGRNDFNDHAPFTAVPPETGSKMLCAITGADSNPGGEHAYVTVRVPKDFVSGQSIADLAGAGKSRELAKLLAPSVAAEEGRACES